MVPEDFEEQRLKSSTTKIPADLDEASSRAVEAWRRRVGRTPTDKETRTEGLKWDAPGFQPPAIDDRTFHAAADATRGRMIVSNDMLTGHVAVAVVVVSSSGGLDFSNDEFKDVLGQVYQAGQFLASEAPAANLSFTYAQYPVTIPGDIQVPDTAMSGGLSAVVYKNKIYGFHGGMRQDGGNLGYNVFDGTHWEGDVLVPQTEFGGQGLSTVVYDNKIYVFHRGSLAEDSQLRYNIFDGTRWEGDKAVPNAVSAVAASALVYENKIYVFYEGLGPSRQSQIWYHSFDGTNWIGDSQVPNATMSASLSPVVFSNKIYCFYEGGDSELSRLRCNVFDGTKWTDDEDEGPHMDPKSGIFTLAYKNSIFCFQQDLAAGKLSLNILNGNSWTGFNTIGDVISGSNISAALFGEQIYFLHQGYGNNSDQLWYRVFDEIDPSGGYYTLESIWRNPVLKKLGYSQSLHGCVEFANHLGQIENTTRAYVGFFIKFPAHHFAYAGPATMRICMEYKNDGWGSENIYKVFAHESCHIFNAADEYPGCNCNPCGVYKVKNGNCKKCNPQQVSCIMDHNTLAMCTYTKGQVGWLPRLGLFVFHQGSGGDGTLWYKVFDGKKWWDDRLVPDTLTSSSPSAVQYDGKVYCFHHGPNKNGKLCYNVFDGANWSGDTEVPSILISSGPSAVLYDNKIYCFYQSYNNDNRLLYIVFDGKVWTSAWAVGSSGSETQIATSAIPSAMVYDTAVYCFYQGLDGNGQLRYSKFEDNTWMGQVQVPDTAISGNPSIVVYNNKLYCFHQGYGVAHSQLWYNVFDGTSWAGDKQVPKSSISNGPFGTVYDGKIYCFYEGQGINSLNDGELHYNVFDGKNWSGNTLVPKASMSAGLGATAAHFPTYKGSISHDEESAKKDGGEYPYIC